MTSHNNNPGCLGFILKIFGLLPKEINSTSQKLPYALRDDFLSNAEFSFYKVLDQAVDHRYVICPKVGLQDIFFVSERDRSEHTTYLNKINRKHVDFLLCDKSTMKPVCGIELDDTSHQRKDRVDRDDFVNELFRVAGLNLIRISNKRSYTISEINELLKNFNETDRQYPSLEQESHPAQILNDAPICQKCGIPMVERTSNRGTQIGHRFYGCAIFQNVVKLMKFSNEWRKARCRIVSL